MEEENGGHKDEITWWGKIANKWQNRDMDPCSTMYFPIYLN